MLKFEEETHKYTQDGHPIMSVTGILTRAGLIDTRWFSDFARNRGSAVHQAIFLDLHDDLDTNTIHPIISPYVCAWQKFRRDTKVVPFLHLVEKPQYHPTYQYAGKPDLPCLLNGWPALIDIKTGDESIAPPQTAAYAEFPELKAVGIKKRFSLRLYQNGNYKLNPHTGANDFLIFLDALNRIRATELTIMEAV